VFLTNSADVWIDQLWQAGIPAAHVNNVEEALQNPQVTARQMIWEMDWPPGSRTKVVGNPVRISDQSEFPLRPPPELGEHTEEILSSMLDFSLEEIQGLKARKII
jgi:crotonobetainyl-CoA:carnitine CoA-transferase CaiB-like acyl-CoA transferase